MYGWTDGTYLAHHGIKGQRWGVRRFQNEDGSLTAAGRSRYYGDDGYLTRGGARRLKRDVRKYREEVSRQVNEEARNKSRAAYDEADKFATKHKLDADDYFDERDRNKILSSGKPVSKTVQNIIEYSKMVDLAEAKEAQYYDNAYKKVNSLIDGKFGAGTVEALSRKSFGKEKKLGLSADGKIAISPNDTATTQKVKANFNSMNDKQFRNTYHVSKNEYAKRVASSPTGDPFRDRNTQKRQAQQRARQAYAAQLTTQLRGY